MTPSGSGATEAVDDFRDEGHNDPDMSVEERLHAFLKTHHPTFYESLQTNADGVPQWIDVRSLPIATQRWVWRLYAKRYPELAQWLRGLDMDAWREQFGAKLELRTLDILAAARLEIAAADPSGADTPPG